MGLLEPVASNVQSIDASVLLPQVRSLSSVESKEKVTLPEELEEVIPVPPVNVRVAVVVMFVGVDPSVTVQY